ncbi:2-(1,2-epoxy-1,2-dihydrophenyl)acetyl-CoA isomerase PaaG [Pseudorhodoplanes sinuspersici]|uniref:2-(1,2-epoxy-1,2-dihydrophenyl)acetyl-CoA isomerase n=1 Tax=Pseudorhodoplanes sinuspersici TaxID=1235591 RepID=A0A1W6ZV71_9HYPH|nr:2-(1,2-epoxy-1,2-dihydrophenyl)acetyl-CoA isomerase PaaG [Pseudorhodoplanes sinuspersici]ARQ00655.1 2-(1,2-epoxy-1,2-dihydrophenyl)acetyl-CoA isomerase [Pseudorhodoplanes sinuspersici]RKE72259.1 enoyl-CoA hydratase [Pseudorhodoplanes sinuspersici]
MDESPILVDKRQGYRVITLNRPQRLNSFTESMHHALKAALDDAQADSTCRALMITGAGRGFCAGQDLNDRLAKPGETIVLGGTLEEFYNPLIRKLRDLPFPVVAAVNGVAAGAGANIALACDIVVAAQSATFLQAFSKIGLVPDSGGTWFLPRLVGPARARGLALLAEPLPAQKAKDWGLIWECYPDDELIGQGNELCERLAAGPTYGLSLIKRALDASETNDLKTQLDLERDLQRSAGSSPDYAEGVKAFMEKRAPNFTGKKGS